MKQNLPKQQHRILQISRKEGIGLADIWNKAFTLTTTWKNLPSRTTPLGESRLNPAYHALHAVDDRVIYLYNTKLDKEVANTLVKSITYNESNGIFTVTYLNGTSTQIDTKLEKIAVNFRFDEVAQKLIITLDDGTEQQIDLSALITQYEFISSETIDFQVQPDGKVTAIVKEGSIQERHLNPNYLADIRVESAKAEAAATAAAESEENAAKSEVNAKASEVAAKESEDAAAASEQAAATSETNAATSEANAAASEAAAKASEDAAAASEAAAKQSEINAAASEAAAGASEANAAASEQAAATSEANAAASEAAAEDSKIAAKASEQAAKASEIAAKTSELAAAGSAETASNKAASAITSASNAAASATQAALSEQTATTKAAEASASAATATNKAKESSNSADLSRSYAVGTSGQVRPNDPTDNSKYYSEQAKKSAELAEATANINLPTFKVDTSNMHLMGTFKKIFDFALVNGHLMLEIGAQT